MNELEQILGERQEKLISNIQTLSEQKINALECINYCFLFIESNILRTENDIKKVPDFFMESIRAKGELRNVSNVSNVSKDDVHKFINIISTQGLAYEASEFIHEEFGKLNEPNYLMDEFGKKMDEYDGFFIQDEENLKLFTFIYHQFFITIISTLDDYFSQLLLLILQAYPEKLGDTKIFQVKFKDVNNLLETGIDKIIIKSMNEQIFSHVRNSMGQKPLSYLTELVKYLEDPKLIRLEKLTFCEMCLRRNAGVHSGWFGNQEYNLKIQELMKADTGNELKFSRNETNFLGFDTNYFKESYETSKNMITTLKTYSENKFIK